MISSATTPNPNWQSKLSNKIKVQGRPYLVSHAKQTQKKKKTIIAH